MSMQVEIETLMQTAFAPVVMRVENESHRHAGPDTESHFKLTLVAQAFEGVSRVKRHQAVYRVMGGRMTLIHALALHLYTPSEWQALGEVAPVSPRCSGGHRGDLGA
ncbi:MAG: BolA family protein [Thiomicrospira sp.]|nr:BolA family protein [Thiomicrospira sp.]